MGLYRKRKRTRKNREVGDRYPLLYLLGWAKIIFSYLIISNLHTFPP